MLESLDSRLKSKIVKRMSQEKLDPSQATITMTAIQLRNKNNTVTKA